MKNAAWKALLMASVILFLTDLLITAFLINGMSGQKAGKDCQDTFSSQANDAENKADKDFSGSDSNEKELTKASPYQEYRCIALTFDDGPHPIYTDLLLDGLKEREVCATFFVTGANAQLYPELIDRIHEEGHQLGNHTMNHTQLTRSNAEQFLQELEETNLILYELTGEEILFVRPPYGCWNDEVGKRTEMIPVLWDIDPLDWCSNDSECITRRVIQKSNDSSVILLHDSFPSSVDAALHIVDELKKQGYIFVTIQELYTG